MEPLGDVTLVFFSCGDDLRLVAKVDGDCDYRVGDSIRFTCNPSGVLFFDAQQGVRLE